MTSTNEPEETTCWEWKGNPELHQEQAAVQAVEDGHHIMPWTTIETICETKHCLNTRHMLFHAPRKLHYPYGICIYCGRAGHTKDHLMPKSTSGSSLRKYVLTVPACGECNSLINDTVAFSITERRMVAHARMRKKHAKKLRAFDYSPEEIEEFGHTLKSVILSGQHDKRAILDRLAWPDDETYDPRYLDQSGIDDPHALGLVTAAN